ncbi:MAG: hypothetical protein H7A45_16355 [Verrucomicrobiales bacterium]|nr:hypothetical protein [Verrucomicrobiales bacterium]MCP5527933.1 hypothetical protein [Verrucomicrobiales bacterium]
MLAGGGSLVTGAEAPFIGPGHAHILQVERRFWLHGHSYDGTDRGRSKLAILLLTRDQDGWPVVGRAERQALR